MTSDILRTAATVDEVTDEKARKAVKVFRNLQPTLTAYARVLSGNPNARVEMAARDNGSTDGERIYFRPPLALGDNTPHERRLCNRRDENGLHICLACRIREEVLVTIYHEIAHICFESFSETTDADKKQAISFAIRESKGKWAKEIAERIQRAPYWKTRDYINLASLINEFLPIIVNALEDARVNRELFKARPGVQAMFDSDTAKIFREGYECRNPDGTFRTQMWNEAPLNSQIIVGTFCKASGYDYSNWFHSDVVEALSDSELTGLIRKMDTIRSAGAVYDLSFKVLARLRELGYCGTPQDPDPEPDEEQSEENAGEERSPDSDSLPSDDATSPGVDRRDESDSCDGSTDKQTEDAGGAASHEAAGSDEPSGSSNEGESESSDGGDDSQESDDSGNGSESDRIGDDSDRSSSGESRGDVSDGTEGNSGESERDGNVDSSSERSSDDEFEEELDNEDASTSGSQEVDKDSGESTGPQDESEDLEGLRGSGSIESVDQEDNLENSERAGSGDDLDDGNLGGSSRLDSVPPDSEASREGPDRDDSASVEVSHESSSESASSDEDEVLDTGADDGYGGTSVTEQPRPEMGTPEEVDPILKKWGDHEEKPKSIETKSEESAVDRAIVQGLYFTTPSVNVFGVRDHVYGEHVRDDNGASLSYAWQFSTVERSKKRAARYGISTDIHVPESVLQPALLKMRRAFSDNKRGARQVNKRSGRVNRNVLGKRAWSGDDRLFQKNIQPGKKDYFVVIGMDISGSTVGVNLALEKRAIMAQASMLDRAGIPFAIYAHTGNYHDIYNSDLGMDLEIYHIKDPNEKWVPEVQQRLEEIGPSAANLDGHAMEYLRKVLDSRSETDKILMYYSDGKMPQENHDEELSILVREIGICRQKRYTLMGVGIRTDSPTRHGLNTVEVWEDSDLVKVVEHLGRRLSGK